MASQLTTQLSSHESAQVIDAVNKLAQMDENADQVDDLIDLIEKGVKMEIDENDQAPFWAIITLGEMTTMRAAPILFCVLDTGWDFWMEAASDALCKIARKHGEKFLCVIEEYIRSRLEYDPGNGRLFAYEAVTVMKPSQNAKALLIKMIDRDAEWSNVIAYDLAQFDDKSLLPILRRGIARAQACGDRHGEIEWREAYCFLDGLRDDEGMLRENLDEDWTKRWRYPLRQLSNDMEQKEDDFEFKIALKDDLFRQRMNEHVERRNQWPLRDFSLQAYLEVRVRSDNEQVFQDTLELIGLGTDWTVEKVQKLINACQVPKDVIDILFEHVVFPSEQASKIFMEHFFDLWNLTPREELQGLTPEEMSQTRVQKKEKIGRNDPCLCGSGKKYKKCHLNGFEK